MGLFNKLKNILFEEEEIEEEVVENRPHERKLVKKEEDTGMMELPKIPREPEKKEKVKEYDFEEETDQELFKSERTFDFPAFDEDEFDDLLPKKEETKVEKPKHREIVEDRYKKEETPKRRDDYISVRVEIPKEEVKKLFKPSPVISPVYGILDKNYKKEDVITRDEKLAGEKVKLDVDSVRKKAFGALEENLDTVVAEAVKIELPEEETTVEEPTVTYYEEVEEKIDDADIASSIEEEALDNLLEETVEEEIDVTKEMELPSRAKKEKDEDEIDAEFEDVEEKLEEPEVEENEELEDIVEEMETSEDVEEDKKDDDENDLFDLIDSMYENKEDE